MPTYVYHHTHFENLSGILRSGGLCCDRICQASTLTVRGIAYQNLKARRMTTPVEVAPGGTLGDYVPFYFGPRSRMLYAYAHGDVTGRPEGQDDIIYIVSSVEAVARAGLPFVFTDGHPVKEPKAFFNDLTDIGQVDLRLMGERYWNDTNEDPDRKRRRQAEFLVWKRFPWQLVLGLATRTNNMLAQLTRVIGGSGPSCPPCALRPNWYYQ